VAGTGRGQQALWFLSFVVRTVFTWKEARMLVLTRKLGQAIKVGNDVVIHVVSLNEHRVQIGIEAPRQVPILRMELDANKQEDDKP
jgi:carbon storage regulator